ncbi:hypothetical protein [Fulvivirga sediminis]|uniref:Secreted protein n=1 Tax=Fulvivirga sediminis TaxID=2803949 RepID=A0A937F6V3_9BACT|nr:hypothetical protein [Fulvivirga sediminis]MBL3657527.1 hypothetical protein [Fulvivirga sediminis]
MKIIRLLLIAVVFSSFSSLISCNDPYDEINHTNEESTNETVGENGESTRGD